jgi:hypothetical protein
MAYDAARQRVVLFGGQDLGDTWEWDGVSWAQRNPAASPTARENHAMAYDAARQRVVLFGGYSGASVFLGDTWEWDGVSWAQRNPAASPTARYIHAMAYDAARQRVVLFGGYGASGLPLGDTWEWDGVSWVPRNPAVSPPPRFWHAMAYDAARQRVVLFGGLPGLLGDTWEYRSTNPASYAPFGSGCRGSAGTPALAAVPDTLPWIGDRFAVKLTGLTPGSSALVWLGRSRTNWGPTPLPHDLAFAGMPGCSLQVSGESFFAVFNWDGSAVLAFGVPNDVTLVGASFFNQAFAVDRSANALGATVSNGGEGRIGSR